MSKIVFYSTYGGYGHVARDLAITDKLSDSIDVHIITGAKIPFPVKNVTVHQIQEVPAVFLMNNPITFTDFYTGSLGPKQYRKHFVEFVNLLDKLEPDLVVVDVTCEFAVYAKIMGFKVASVYITGERNDLRHLLNFGNVDHIIVPYPEKFTNINYYSKSIRKKMFFSGGFSRFDGQKIIDKKVAKEKIGLSQDDYMIICSVGKGDFGEKLIKTFNSAIDKIPKVKGFVIENNDQVIEYLNAADLAVTGTGDNTVMENCYYQIPTIVVPLVRPYKEQEIKAENLEHLGAMYKISETNLTTNKLIKLINKIKSSPKIQNSMRQAQSKIVDGLGADRLASTLVKWAES